MKKIFTTFLTFVLCATAAVLILSFLDEAYQSSNVYWYGAWCTMFLLIAIPATVWSWWPKPAPHETKTSATSSSEESLTNPTYTELEAYRLRHYSMIDITKKELAIPITVMLYTNSPSDSSKILSKATFSAKAFFGPGTTKPCVRVDRFAFKKWSIEDYRSKIDRYLFDSFAPKE